MLKGLIQLLLCQFAGEWLAHALNVPIPGPVVGMLLLLAMLVIRQETSPSLRDVSQALQRHLALLFIPAGAGIMLHFRRITDEWVALTAAVVVSTLIAMIVTALTFRSLSRWQARRAGRKAA